jgi:hypothetical protein
VKGLNNWLKKRRAAAHLSASFETIMMAVVLDHEKRVGELARKFEELGGGEPHV